MRQRDLNPQPTVKSRALYQLSYPPLKNDFLQFSLYKVTLRKSFALAKIIEHLFLTSKVSVLPLDDAQYFSHIRVWRSPTRTGTFRV